MPKFRCVPALLSGRGIDFSRGQRDQALAPPGEHHQGLWGALPIVLPALREEFHDTWTHARIFVGLLSPAVRR
jgi:hypothetical protein